MDENGKIDFNDKSVTENTRVSYPIDHIDNIVKHGIIKLTLARLLLKRC